MIDILVIGSGGREHALIWKLSQSLKVRNIFVAPGNAGTAAIARNLAISKAEDILKWLDKNRVDLVVIGPDNYLADGIVDTLKKRNISVFGPTKDAAKIEWSKSFAKKLMSEENIPTAQFKVFRNIDKAKRYSAKQKFPIVIKADGLAFGKGVIIANNVEEAGQALNEIMKHRIFGSAGKEVIIEEYLEGREISIHAFCDSVDAVLFPSSKDHKRIYDGDNGPNTGGMGVIAPAPGITDKNLSDIKNKIILPILAALKKRGTPFCGILFPGIMMTKDGPKVIEFNARFGDPETQSYMRLLQSDLVDILMACIKGKLKNLKIKWSNKYACCIICASGGYPGKYKSGRLIIGLDSDMGRKVVVFHAGTKKESNNIITAGGRVLGLSATGKTLKLALSSAYNAVKKIKFDGIYYRKDIGRCL